ncbi:MAG: MT-A70 family methyltransferase [Sporolactobacillus sp.]
MDLPNDKFKVIYADPPWSYRQQGSAKGKRGMANAHYTTMSTQEIGNLPVQQIATDDALLFLWSTFPNLPAASVVMAAWGFEYKTAAFVWIKKNKRSGTNFFGMGAWTRANAEVCLLGARPEAKAGKLVKSHAVQQIVEAPVQEHSRKPSEVRERIVQLVGDVPRIELFAREKTPGWDAWGDEVGE